LEYDEPFAVIDFVKTTEFHEGKAEGNSMVYEPFPPDRILIEDYPQLRSALITRVVNKLAEFEQHLDRIQQRIDKQESRAQEFVTVTVGAIAILFAGLAVFVSSKPDWSMPIWDALSVGTSLLALLFARRANPK
jgi:hypothetical protein